jgi:hypothetical protein
LLPEDFLCPQRATVVGTLRLKPIYRSGISGNSGDVLASRKQPLLGAS